MVMSNGTTTVLRGLIGMSLYPDTTPSSSAAMPEQSVDASSTPLHAHVVRWASTSSTTCRMYSTEQPLYLPDQTPKHIVTFSQTNGLKNSMAHTLLFITRTRNRGDAYNTLFYHSIGKMFPNCFQPLAVLYAWILSFGTYKVISFSTLYAS